MDLDQEFTATVERAISSLWQRSVIAKMLCTTANAWASTNAAAIEYCLDHELFAEQDPSAARTVHRAIDIYGRPAIVRFLDDKLKLVVRH